MIGYIDKIKEVSAKLLSEEKVDLVIGYRQGSVPMMNEPFIARTAADVDQLVWDANCRLNLANYVTNRKDKIGIIAKGCDSRNLVTAILENKISRDQLVIIGVPCKGMIDKCAVAALTDEEIVEVVDQGDTVLVKGAAGFEKTVAKAEVTQENCQTCQKRNPVISDELVADEVPELGEVDRYAAVEKIEAMSEDERWAFFDELFSECTRCYACKNACPLCYCPTCFVDESRPQWVGKGTDPIDVKTYHFLRAYHCAGRCTDCGACEAACPMNIKMKLLTKKLDKECQDKWGWSAGMSLDKRPALDHFRIDDPEAFIK